MKKMMSLIIALLLVANLSGCGVGSEDTKLFAGYRYYYSDGGLSGFEEHSYEYDKKGNLVKECVYYNGYLTSYSVIEYSDGCAVISSYSNHDKLQSVRELFEDGSLKSELLYGYSDEPESYTEYDESGLKVFKESYKYDYHVDYEYDGSGNLIKETETDHEEGCVKIYETEYDADGTMIRRTVTYPDGSSVVDRETEIVTEGNVRTLLERSSNGELRYKTVEEYDADGNLLKSVIYNAEDDSILSSNEYKYDEDGRVVENTYFFMETSVTRYEYADEGYICKETVSRTGMMSDEPYGDGSDAYEAEITNVTYYDADGDVTRTEYLVNGGIRGYAVYTYEYVNVRGAAVFDYRDEELELDPRATIVY